MRLLPVPKGESPLSWYGAAVGVLWPGMMVATHRDWRGQSFLGSSGQGRVIVANHVSWFDPFVLAHYLNDSGRAPRFLAKASVFDVPVGGQILAGAKQIRVYRESGNAAKAVEAAVEAVQDGEAVVVYPEGTITRDPQLWPMRARTGAARIALTTRTPVIPVAQWGAHEVMAPYKLEARLWPIKTMHVWAGPAVDLSDLHGRGLSARTLELATDRIMDAITAQLAQIRGEMPPAGRWDRKLDRRVPTLTETEPDTPARRRTSSRRPAARVAAPKTAKKQATTRGAAKPRPTVGRTAARKAATGKMIPRHDQPGGRPQRPSPSAE